MHLEEVRTEPLAVSQLTRAVPEIIDFLRSWGYDRVQITYGWGCRLPIERLWCPIQFDVSQLGVFVEAALREGMFQFGNSDLHIEDLQKKLEFLICHESDIHFASTDQNLVEEIIAKWLDRGFVVYVSPGPKGSARAKEWTRLGKNGAEHVPPEIQS